MRGWVWAKQMWDPSLDTQSLMKDFVFGYYKESASPLWEYQMMMWSYWEKWHRLPHQCGEASDNPLLNNLHCSYAPDGPMFTADFMAKMRDCHLRAEGLAQSDEIRSRVKKAKLPLLYLELAQHLGYYSEFGDFIYGRSLRNAPAQKRQFQPLLDEFTALCRRHGLTNLGIPITLDKITAKWQSCIRAESDALPKVFLPAEWVFRADSADQGLAEKWYADSTYFAAAATLTDVPPANGAASTPLSQGLARLHINRGVGWEQQGFPSLDGYGWYFQNVEVPEDLARRKHLYLYFLGVNEQAWVYVNGELAGERTYAGTGKGVGDLASAPFSVDARKWLKPGRNTVAVRVTHASGLGGMWLPAMLIGVDEPRSTEQLSQFRF